jgi:hypothetical protein
VADVTEREPGPVEAAVLADLERWGAAVAGTGLAALAVNGARRLDDPDLSPTPASMLLAQVRETMVTLSKLAPERDENDAIDEIARKRDERRGA